MGSVLALKVRVEMLAFFLELKFSLASVGGFVVVTLTKKEERGDILKRC